MNSQFLRALLRVVVVRVVWRRVAVLAKDGFLSPYSLGISPIRAVSRFFFIRAKPRPRVLYPPRALRHSRWSTLRHARQTSGEAITGAAEAQAQRRNAEKNDRGRKKEDGLRIEEGSRHTHTHDSLSTDTAADPLIPPSFLFRFKRTVLASLDLKAKQSK